MALGVVLSLGGIIGLQLTSLASELPRCQSTVRDKIGSLREGSLGRLPEIIRNVGRQIDQAAQEAPQPEAKPSPAAPPGPQPLPVEVHHPDPTPTRLRSPGSTTTPYWHSKKAEQA